MFNKILLFTRFVASYVPVFMKTCDISRVQEYIVISYIYLKKSPKGFFSFDYFSAVVPGLVQQGNLNKNLVRETS